MTLKLINFWFVLAGLQTASDLYDFGKLKTDKNDTADVIIVTSINDKCPKNKKAIFIRPVSNPYYDKDKRIDNENSNFVSLDDTFEKIKVLNNIYYD